MTAPVQHKDDAPSTSRSELHEAALAYAAQGWPVFPCVAGTKKPATPNGFKDASRDPAQIDAWWAEDPNFNVAFSPAAADQAVIDIDGVEGEQALAALELEHGLLPPSKIVRTPRGGRHLYFAGVVRPTQGTDKRGLGPKIDTRGEGSYCLLAPSRVGAGEYRLEQDRPLAPLPAWVGEVIESRRHAVERTAVPVELDLPGNVARARNTLKSMVARGDVAIEGQMGDNKTFVTACQMRELGVSEDVCLDIMLEIFNPACEPPWEADALAVKVSSAYRNGENAPGVWAVASPEEAFGEALGKLALEEPPAARPSRFRPILASERHSQPKLRFIVPGLVQADALNLFWGAPASGKTFVVLDILLSIASGLPAFGKYPVEQGPTVLCAGEGSGSILNKRLPAWGKSRGLGDAEIDALPFAVVPNVPHLAGDRGDSDVSELIEQIQATGLTPKALAVDTVSRAIAGEDENAAKTMSAVVEKLEVLRQAFPGAAIIPIHHSGKDPATGPRGGSPLTGGVDMSTLVTRPNRARLHVVLKNDKAKETEEAEDLTLIGEEVRFAEGPLGTSAVYRVASDTEKRQAAPADVVEQPADPYVVAVREALERLRDEGRDETRGQFLASDFAARAIPLRRKAQADGEPLSAKAILQNLNDKVSKRGKEGPLAQFILRDPIDNSIPPPDLRRWALPGYGSRALDAGGEQ